MRGCGSGASRPTPTRPSAPPEIAAGQAEGAALEARGEHAAAAALYRQLAQRSAAPWREDLLLLAIDETRLSAEVRYEDAGDGRLFPHIYGPLEVEAVIEVVEFQPNPDGSFDLPEVYQQ